MTMLVEFASLLVPKSDVVLVPIAGIVIAVSRWRQTERHSRTAIAGFSLLASSGLLSIFFTMWRFHAVSTGVPNTSDLDAIAATAIFCSTLATIGMIFVLTSVFGIANVPSSQSEDSGQDSNWEGKSRAKAAFLAYALGGLGAHKFYLGKNLPGVFYLLLCWTFVPAVIGFVEGTVYVAMGGEEFRRTYG